MPAKPSGVAFLDRDGTINRKAPEGDYVKHAREVALLPGAAQAVRRLNDAGVWAIVVSNQRGIALGRMTEHDLEQVNEALSAQLSKASGAHINAFFHCPHDIGTCDCRKPGIGMFVQAQECFPWIDIARSVMIGDSDSDIQAGQALGLRAVRLGIEAPDLEGAIELLLPSQGPV